jgi:hypothetical protein
MDTTRVYIDGFNLYHGIIQSNRLHWLDLQRFSERLNRGQPVDRIIYCTASVSSTPTDPNKSQRQDAYHRAIGVACPRVEIVRGNFTTNKKLRPIAGCVNGPPCAVKVSVREEKGSDVNLAARLLHDAHMGRFDRAIVVSGDSDLVEPIRLVVSEVGKTVWVRNPRDVASAELAAVASEYARIRPAVLQATQLPDPVTDGVKQYSKPARWSAPLPLAAKKEILSVPCPQPGCAKVVVTCRYE